MKNPKTQNEGLELLSRPISKALYNRKRVLLMSTLCGAGILGGFGPTPGKAGPIIQDQVNAGGVFSSPYLKGQSFTAEDAAIQSVGIGVMVANPQFADTTIRMSLYTGIGRSGGLLLTRTLTPAPAGPAHTRAWVDFDVSEFNFEPGSTYSMAFSASSYYWFGSYHQWAYPNGSPYHGYDYTGGIFFNEEQFYPHIDLTFRVIPVPEPSTVGLGALAFVGLVLCRRRLFNTYRF